MLEIAFIRQNAQLVKDNLAKRGTPERAAEVDEALRVDEWLRSSQATLDDMRAQRNKLSLEINSRKKKGEDASSFIEKAKTLPGEIAKLEAERTARQQELRAILFALPNLLHESVPFGASDADNQVIREVGRKPTFSFDVKSHVDLLEPQGFADLERAAKISGARFYFLKNEMVLLEQALIRFALDLLFSRGYTLLEPPFLMRQEPYEGVTDLKDFEDVMYKIEGEDLFLIATSEHPMAAMHAGETLAQLPLKYAAISPCFRKEAGAHGKDTKGIFRVHQFNKVEQFIFCEPSDSWKHFDELLANSEAILTALKLPYRAVSICTGDIGTVASKKIDLEVWMPASQTYREVVSCSNVLSYQAARLGIRTPAKELAHTLNSTALATTRMLVAIIENYQNADGTVTVPDALHPYMHGIKRMPA